MKDTWKMCTVLIGLAFCSHSLVYEIVMPTWKEGCVGFTKELKVGEFEQDPKVCGILVCMNLDGTCLIYFCQQPAGFQHCDNNTVSLDIDYPDCCWTCTEAVPC